jgi:hypothetical protein
LVVAVLLACAIAVSCGRNPAGPSDVVPALTPVDAATILLFDDFDAENNGVGSFNWTTFTNWNVLRGCVDLHGNGLFDVQPGNGLYVDLDGSCAAGGAIESKQAFTLEPGNYVFEFFLGGNNRINSADTVNVHLGSLYQEQFVVQQRQGFELKTRNISVASATSARIAFENLGADGRGALVDLVRLRRAQ